MIRLQMINQHECIGDLDDPDESFIVGATSREFKNALRADMLTLLVDTNATLAVFDESSINEALNKWIKRQVVNRSDLLLFDQMRTKSSTNVKVNPTANVLSPYHDLNFYILNTLLPTIIKVHRVLCSCSKRRDILYPSQQSKPTKSFKSQQAREKVEQLVHVPERTLAKLFASKVSENEWLKQQLSKITIRVPEDIEGQGDSLF